MKLPELTDVQLEKYGELYGIFRSADESIEAFKARILERINQPLPTAPSPGTILDHIVKQYEVSFSRLISSTAKNGYLWNDDLGVFMEGDELFKMRIMKTISDCSTSAPPA